ncbi:MAG: signal peptide peptidase SppA [Flavobacteriales bacterium]|nr:signal peptide peptidase SppA [Flavobacteriales bacterium]|tara:strand:- start:13581 stop:15329 length:1749 start_codon:yes stop_codon:yes gene_type:complete
MKDFLKNILSSALGSLLAGIMLIGSILIITIFIGIISTVFSNDNKIESKSILKIEFDYPIYDKPNSDPFKNFNPLGDFEANNSKHLYQILKSIELAAENKNIEGIVLDLRQFQSPGQASAKEIRNALNNFKQKNKFIYSYSNYFNKTAYYIASVSDSIFMYPIGALELSGLSSTTPFFTETMAKIGIKPEIIRYGKFKAAIEPFMLTEMSEENRAQTKMLLSDVWEDMLRDISLSRNIPIKTLNEIADDLSLSMLPNKPIEFNLIDQLILPDEFNNFLAKKLNIKDVENLEFISIEKLKEENNKSKNKIAIIYAEGNIDGDNNNIHSGYTNTIKEVLKNESIYAVVLRVNSPGGSVLISDELLSQMRLWKKEKPIVVSMGNYAASGGYYISCAADKIFASPNTITGSIGVFGLFFTAEELLTEKMKLKFDNVKTNKFANMGELNKSLSEEERRFLQMSVTQTYNDFISHVANARNMSKEDVDNIGQGRVWTGLRAHQIGLVDEIGGLSDAINSAAELAKLDDFQIVEFPKVKNGLESIFESMDSKQKLLTEPIEEIYLEGLKNKFIKMQGIQALLPVKYELN